MIFLYVLREDLDAEKKQLLMNHRCAPRLVTIQRIFAQAMTDDDVDVQPNKKWEKNEGECEILHFANSTQEATEIAHRIANWISEEKCKCHDICLIVRQKPASVCNQLIEILRTNHSIPARIEEDYQDLLAERSVEILNDMILMAIAKDCYDAWTETFQLWMSFHSYMTDENSHVTTRRTANRFMKFIMRVATRLSEVKSFTEILSLCWNILEFFESGVAKEYLYSI